MQYVDNAFRMKGERVLVNAVPNDGQALRDGDEITILDDNGVECCTYMSSSVCEDMMMEGR